jgi:hypothetical protein
MLSHRHWPLMQDRPLVQACPQPPQLLISKRGSAQRGPATLSQQIAPGPHDRAQLPLTQLLLVQAWLAPQGMLQAPQLSWSVWVSTHLPLHSTWLTELQGWQVLPLQ